MGDMRRIFITGGGGFVGRATLATAQNAGFDVVAPRSSEIDLGSEQAAYALAGAMAECSTVVHLAAAMGGDAQTHERVTVNGTKAVLQAMGDAGVEHLVLVSSLAVYDLPKNGSLSASSNVVGPEAARDVYAAAKRQQELLAEAAELKSLTILRPGIVYDDDHLWNAHLGVGVGPMLLRFPTTTLLPMCHVQLIARRIVDAIKTPHAAPALVMDAEIPSRSQVIEALRRSGWPKISLPFPWGVLRVVAQVLSPFAPKLPGLLRTPVLEQRLYPMGRVTAPAPKEWNFARGGAS